MLLRGVAWGRNWCELRRRLSEDVEVDGRVLDEGEEARLDVFDERPLLRFSLPAAAHQQVNLFGARAGTLQFAALRDALDGLRGAAQRNGRHEPLSGFCHIIYFFFRPQFENLL